jgi:hypothetical protein
MVIFWPAFPFIGVTEVTVGMLHEVKTKLRSDFGLAQSIVPCRRTFELIVSSRRDFEPFEKSCRKNQRLT